MNLGPFEPAAKCVTTRTPRLPLQIKKSNMTNGRCLDFFNRYYLSLYIICLFYLFIYSLLQYCNAIQWKSPMRQLYIASKKIKRGCQQPSLVFKLPITFIILQLITKFDLFSSVLDFNSLGYGLEIPKTNVAASRHLGFWKSPLTFIRLDSSIHQIWCMLFSFFLAVLAINVANIKLQYDR